MEREMPGSSWELPLVCDYLDEMLPDHTPGVCVGPQPPTPTHPGGLGCRSWVRRWQVRDEVEKMEEEGRQITLASWPWQSLGLLPGFVTPWMCTGAGASTVSSVTPLGLSLTSLTWWGEQFHASFGSLQAACPMCMPGILKSLPNTPEMPQTQRGAHRVPPTPTHRHTAWKRQGINTLRQTSTNGLGAHG